MSELKKTKLALCCVTDGLREARVSQKVQVEFKLITGEDLDIEDFEVRSNVNLIEIIERLQEKANVEGCKWRVVLAPSYHVKAHRYRIHWRALDGSVNATPQIHQEGCYFDVWSHYEYLREAICELRNELDKSEGDFRAKLEQLITEIRHMPCDWIDHWDCKTE